jgi:predicted porin
MKTRTARGRILFSAVSILTACLVARTAAANLDLQVATPSPVDQVGAAPGAPEAATTLGNWEVFTDGRMGGFASYVRGDGFPPDTFMDDGTGNLVRTRVPFGGGISVNSANPIADPSMPNAQPTLESWRIRSGFLGNIFGLGFRYHLTPWTTLTAYFQYWADIESESRRKYTPMPVDARQGYARVEGLWGTVTVGRQLTLFSRGAVEIDFLYGHGYSMGFPTAVDSNGPAAGHIGTGVLGPGFAGGIMYSTPKLAGVQLNVSVFDPVALQGAWDRTKEPRPEAELTYDLGWGTGKLHLFANGAYQRVYRIGEPDSTNEAAYGAGGGARFEVGPVHLGVAGHWGQGLGLYYALETTEAAYDASAAHRLRKSFGLYGQAQVSIRKVDVNAGFGYAGVTPLPAQTVTINSATGPMTIMIPADGEPDATGLRQSLIKYQLGISGVIVYHVSPHLHISADYFRANFAWQLGEHQNVNFASAGMIITW